MDILPAIDLKDGRCVRLRQGRAEDATVYGENPVEMARHWVAQGATALHVVDLDGAFRGKPAHASAIAAIVGAAGVPVQVGGGLRTDEDIQMILDCGVRRAILGTRVVTEPGALGRLVARFGDRIAVGIDARDGRVQVKGWVETTGLLAADLAADVAAAGVATIIYTDTSLDGMLAGVNAPGVAAVCARVGRTAVIASGGITAAADIRALRALGAPNLTGAIVGKALYEGRVSVRDLTDAAKERT